MQITNSHHGYVGSWYPALMTGHVRICLERVDLLYDGYQVQLSLVQLRQHIMCTLCVIRFQTWQSSYPSFARKFILKLPENT